MFLRSAPAVALMALASPVLAQGFTGGELTIDAYAFSEGDDPTGTNYSGALEYSVNRSISVAGAISVYDFSLLDESVTNVTLHGIYHLSDEASVGAFVGNESSGDDDVSFYGIEGGYETGQFEVEGYIAAYDNDDDSTVLGLSGAYQFNDTISGIANIGFGSIGDQDYTRLSAGAEYEFIAGPSVYAEIGSISSDEVDSTFIGLGASIQFGAERGTTFDRRGAFESINPGF